MSIQLPTILTIASALVLHGCGQQAQEDPARNAHTTSTQESTPSATNKNVPSVTLDNGKRWKANPETTTGIINMASILGAYDQDSGDPQAIKAALEEEFGLIFERCTMTGEAHEQLHNYLLPIHHQLHDFEGTAEQCTALGEHLAAYGTYFE